METSRPITLEITDERLTDRGMVKPMLKDNMLNDASMDGACDKENAIKVMTEKEWQSRKSESERMRLSKQAWKEPNSFSNFRSTVTTAGEECISMGKVGSGCKNMVFLLLKQSIE
jgi:hypothetical protein